MVGLSLVTHALPQRRMGMAQGFSDQKILLRPNPLGVSKRLRRIGCCAGARVPANWPALSGGLQINRCKRRDRLMKQVVLRYWTKPERRKGNTEPAALALQELGRSRVQ